MLTNLHHILIILLILLSDSLVNTFDYIDNHTLQCTQLSSYDTKLQANLSDLWGILILHIIDKVCFLVMCPIILISQIVVLFTFKKHSQLRAKPGNIFCSLVIIQMMLNIHLLANAIYRTTYDHRSVMPDSFVGFCTVMGFISAFFSLLHFMYLILFMFHTVFIFRFTLKKKSQLFWIMLHVFVITSSIGLTIFFYFYDFMGLNFYGLCGVTATRRVTWNATLPGIQILSSIIFIILGVFTYVYFKKHMPGSEGFRRRKVQQGKIIFMYVTGFSMFLIFISVMNLMLQINCTQQKPIPQINVLTTIVNLSRLLQFCFLLFLIMYNERFRIKLKQVLKSIFQKTFIRSTSLQITQTIQLEDVFFNEKLLQLKYRSNQIDLLLLSQIYTIISGIYIAYYEYFRDFTFKQKIRKINYLESVTFCLDNKTIRDYQAQSRFLVKLKILPCQITIHAPKVFKQLLDMDYLHEVFQSFHIVDNSRKLSNLAQGKGGKSGQFFFFSSDNKYVIKTITEEQFNFYTENLSTFYEYFQQNTESLLAKIYGLFTIKGDQMQRTYRLILMKNILGCQKDQILRLYDLKGSKHDRQVLFSEIQMNQISKMTLKDIDFINYETAINVSPMKSYELRQILRKDTIFLKSLNLLDYSLLVVRVRWPHEPQHHNFWGQFQRIPHYFEKNQYYHIGIIDYMQKWDFNKKSEKWWKNLMGKKDFSAQQPQKYQLRFMQFVEQITSGPVKTEKNRSRMPEVSGIQMKQVKQLLRQGRAATQPQKQMDTHSLSASIEGKQRSTNKL